MNEGVQQSERKKHILQVLIQVILKLFIGKTFIEDACRLSKLKFTPSLPPSHLLPLVSHAYPDGLLSLSVGRLQLQDAGEVLKCLIQVVGVLVQVGTAQDGLCVGLIEFNGPGAVPDGLLLLVLWKGEMRVFPYTLKLH